MQKVHSQEEVRDLEKDLITGRYKSDREGAVLVSGESEQVRRSTGNKSGGKSGKQSTAEKAARNNSAKKQPEPSAKVRKNRAKTSAEPPKKRSAHTEEQSDSIKTPSVMKLIEDTTEMENQVIAAGKSRIPRQLRGIEPLSRVIRREAEAEKQLEEKQSRPLVTRELTEMVAQEESAAILARFNGCDCEVCRSELARRAAEELPARYIRLPEGEGLDWSGFTDEERLLIGSVKKSVTSAMIRLMMGNRRRNFHG